MALLLWLCLAGVVLALLSPIAPAIAAMKLFKHAKSNANAPLFADIKRLNDLSERFARAADALPPLVARVSNAFASIGGGESGI